MSRRISVSQGMRGVALPNGLVLSSGETTVLSDGNWALLSGSPLLGVALVDQGATNDPVDEGATARKEIGFDADGTPYLTI